MSDLIASINEQCPTMPCFIDLTLIVLQAGTLTRMEGRSGGEAKHMYVFLFDPLGCHLDREGKGRPPIMEAKPRL
jgi:hypothetical protein